MMKNIGYAKPKNAKNQKALGEMYLEARAQTKQIMAI